MFSVKRLLNEDVEDGSGRGYGEQESFHQEDYRPFSAQGDDPVLAEKSWDSLYRDILSSDFPNGNEMFQMELEGPSGAFIHNVEENIESWAEQTMPATIDSLLNMQENLPEAMPSDAPVDKPAMACYGMIYRAAVRIGGNMVEMNAKMLANFDYKTNDCCTFGLRKKEDQVVLHFPDGSEFSLLNNHTAKALEKLVDRPTFQFEAHGYVRTILDTIGRVTKQADAVVRVNINVYGPKESSREVGRLLTDEKVYLQRPEKLRAGMMYENPHVLGFADIETETMEIQIDVGNERVAKLDDAEKFKEAISNVYSSLTRGANLNKVEGDRRLRTTLLAHQKEALDFMLQRENGPIPPEFRLWKALDGEDEGCYRHAVTKARNRSLDPETGGGILADEMGMGKSLSTLALITKTLDKATDWVIEKKANPDPHSRLKPCRATLVVVPSAILINEWYHEIHLHLDGTLGTLRYHGPKRKKLPLEEADLVLTTYHTIVSDYGDRSSPLHDMEWYRVVLDEAHIIRRQATTFFKAVTDLKARSRWCLTGTPIQNKLDDIGSLFAFIRAYPFHAISMFRRFVSTPFDETVERRDVATKNLTLLLESLCLRRSRELLNLPEPQHKYRTIKFSPEERKQYEQTKMIMNRALRQKVGEEYSKNIFGMFQVQLQLRILCNHGTYQHPFSWARRSLQDEREDALNSLGGYGEVNCSACRQSLPVLGSNTLYRKYPGSCAHIVCRECLLGDEQCTSEMLDMATHCPLCTVSGVNTAVIPPQPGMIESDEGYLRKEGCSSKMNALIEDIKEDLETTKSIVFSCWTNTLNLIERYLIDESIPFYRIDGDSPLGLRQRILDDFSDSSDISVLIMTTGTGAFGLNLTTANRVFIIEPQWNPSVENQAVSRAIRMNQTKSVLVTKYIVEGTVEQEMLSQQKRKIMIAEIGNSNSCME